MCDSSHQSTAKPYTVQLDAVAIVTMLTMSPVHNTIQKEKSIATQPSAQHLVQHENTLVSETCSIVAFTMVVMDVIARTRSLERGSERVYCKRETNQVHMDKLDV